MAAGGSVAEIAESLGVSDQTICNWRRQDLIDRGERSVMHSSPTSSPRCVDSRGTYGALRVHAELTLRRGIVVGHNAVAMLMRRAELSGLPGKRRRRFAPQVATAADLVERDFARQGPDELWVTDITEHPTR